MGSAVGVGPIRTARIHVVRSGVQAAFAAHLRRARNTPQRLVIASPWISESSSPGQLAAIVALIRARSIPTYVFTRTPATDPHRVAVSMLSDCSSTEIVFNENLHAKVYACLAPYPFGFALLGSANLTRHSELMYEVGLMILGTGGGEAIVKELASFGMDYLRTRPESVVWKRITRRSTRDGV